MIRVIYSMESEHSTATLDSSDVEVVAREAINTIKKGLPEEAQTVEVVKFIISEMKNQLKEKKICL